MKDSNMEAAAGPAGSDRAAFLRQRPVSRETLAALDAYAAGLVKWQKAINLVGPSTLETLWTRHFLDSLQLLDAAPGALRWVDLGSGAGFPGLVLAIALKGKPGAGVTLVESNGKKAGFLQAMARETGAPCQIHAARIATVAPQLPAADVVTARALAPLADLLALSEPLLKKGATALFPKGRDLDKELQEASRYWDFKHEIIPSLVAKDSSLIRLTTVRRRSAAG